MAYDYVSIYSIFLMLGWSLRFNNQSYVTDIAEILSKKDIGGRAIYYIHYDDCKYNYVTF